MAGEVVLIDPQTGLSYKAGGTSGPQPSASSQSVTPATDADLASKTNQTNGTQAARIMAYGPLTDNYTVLWSTAGSLHVTVAPGSGSSTALNRQFTSAAASSLVVKASAGNLFGYNIVSGAVAGYVMFFDSPTVPADGTVTPKMCFALAANASIQADRDIPVRFTTGITMVFSSTGPFTKTASATAFLAGDAA